MEDYDKAIVALERGRDLTFDFLCNQVFLCLIYTFLGRAEKAELAKEEVLQLTEGCTPVLREMYIEPVLLRRYRGLIERAGLQ
jgi:hypothetical protein